MILITALTYTGLVYPAGVDHSYFPVHENITLNVAVNPISKVSYNFRTLTWFHNGNQLHHGERVAISEDNTELTIYDIPETDSGVYEAKFTGLVIQPYSRSCEAGVLDLLAHYPVLRAAVFHLTNGQEGMLFLYRYHEMLYLNGYYALLQLLVTLKITTILLIYASLKTKMWYTSQNPTM